MDSQLLAARSSEDIAPRASCASVLAAALAFVIGLGCNAIFFAQWTMEAQNTANYTRLAAIALLQQCGCILPLLYLMIFRRTVSTTWMINVRSRQRPNCFASLMVCAADVRWLGDDCWRDCVRVARQPHCARTLDCCAHGWLDSHFAGIAVGVGSDPRVRAAGWWLLAAAVDCALVIQRAVHPGILQART